MYMDESSWVSRCRTVEVIGIGQGEHGMKVIKIDQRERGINKDLDRDRLVWKSIVLKLSNTCQHVKWMLN